MKGTAEQQSGLYLPSGPEGQLLLQHRLTPEPQQQEAALGAEAVANSPQPQPLASPPATTTAAAVWAGGALRRLATSVPLLSSAPSAFLRPLSLSLSSSASSTASSPPTSPSFSPASSPSSTSPSPLCFRVVDAIMSTFAPLSRSCFGIDIGGTLCKISYFEKDPSDDDSPEEVAFREKMKQLIADPATYGTTGFRDEDLEFPSRVLGGHVYLLRFETHRFPSFLTMVKESTIVNSQTVVCCTGGGSRKFAPDFKRELGVDVPNADELTCVVDGINFFLLSGLQQLYRVDHSTFKDTGEKIFGDVSERPFPYLLVNIGSGVSMLHVTESGKPQRVGGTALGGATFFGLCSLITQCTSFSKALELAGKGSAANIDLLVSDIYGGDYEEYGLSGDLVASSLGKLVRPEVREKARPEDLARALLDAITNNIGSIALLQAKLHGIRNVVFAGSFLRRNRISIARLSYAMQFWSGGQREAMFLSHEGYLGCIGALLFGAHNHASKRASAQELPSE